MRGLKEEGINFVSPTDSIGTSTPARRFFFHVMASLAETERVLSVERTRAGLQAARSEGRVGGWRRVMTEGKVEVTGKLLASGLPRQDVATDLGVSVATIVLTRSSVRPEFGQVRQLEDVESPRTQAIVASAQPITNPPKTISSTSNTVPVKAWRSRMAPRISMTAQTRATMTPVRT